MVRTVRQGAGALGLVVLMVVAAIGAGHAEDETAVPNPPIPNPPPLAQSLPNERKISLRHYWTREELSVVYRVGNGYLAEALAEINWLLRDYRCSRFTEIDPKLIDLLYSLQQELKPTSPIQVVSGYRSEGYNASLLRAGRTVDPDSQHTQGRAIDVVFPGVPADRVREAAEARGIGGVGYYPFSGPVFVHIDTGPVRHWAETDPRVSRAMGIARRRTRFSLDCTLTTDEVLEEITPEQAYSALPAGAASKPHPATDAMQNASAANVSAAAFHPMPGQSTRPAVTHVSLQEDGDGPACMGAEPLAPLALLSSAPSQPVAALKRLRGRLQARRLQKQRVKGLVRMARRAATRKTAVRQKSDPTGSKAAQSWPDWEKSTF
jgi:uncharacterized protein YcbK (DUF882 family)